MSPPRRADHPSESRRAQRHRDRLAARRKRIVLVVGGVVIVALVGGGVWATTRPEEEEEEEATPLLVLGDYSISGTLLVDAGHVKFAVANIGRVSHNVGFRGGPVTTDLPPGQASGLEVPDLKPGVYELFCDIGDHEERGMVSQLTVRDPSAATTTG